MMGIVVSSVWMTVLVGVVIYVWVDIIGLFGFLSCGARAEVLVSMVTFVPLKCFWKLNWLNVIVATSINDYTAI